MIAKQAALAVFVLSIFGKEMLLLLLPPMIIIMMLMMMTVMMTFLFPPLPSCPPGETLSLRRVNKRRGVNKLFDVSHSLGVVR